MNRGLQINNTLTHIPRLCIFRFGLVYVV